MSPLERGAELTPEELDGQELAELPDREALTTIMPVPGPTFTPMPIQDGATIMPWPADESISPPIQTTE